MGEVRTILIGVGQLGRRFCHLVEDKGPLLRDRYGLTLRLVGVADSRGAAYDPAGLVWSEVAAIKEQGGSVAELDAARAGWDALTLVEQADADLLLEASPVNLETGGEPGLSCIRTALQRGMHVVTPNKGPLVLAFDELHRLAEEAGVALRFDGTVAGGLPAINLAQRDLRGATILRIEAVPNLVTGYVMDLLTEGLSYEEALKRAREAGVLEANPAWDLEGWDAAAKLVILTRSATGYPATLEEVARSGIESVTPEELRAARERGYRYRLLASAALTDDGDYLLSVAPVPLPSEHPLGRLGSKQMGVVFNTDIYGTITAIIEESSPLPSAATMLRDILDIYGEEGG